MAIVKMRGWEIGLIQRVGVPMLKKLHKRLEESAKDTETEADDALADFFGGAIELIESPDFFEQT